MENIIYIGMDVHKESFSLCALHGTTGEIVREARCASNVSLFKKFVEKLRTKYGKNIKIKAGLFCASRKCREMQRKVQRLAATFLNFDFSISRR
ncbi:TPA: hypothetical protein ACGW44_005392 [Bacillus toyonensis]